MKSFPNGQRYRGSSIRPLANVRESVIVVAERWWLCKGEWTLAECDFDYHKKPFLLFSMTAKGQLFINEDVIHILLKANKQSLEIFRARKGREEYRDGSYSYGL